MLKSGAESFRAINTNMLEFFGIWGRWLSVETCRSDRKVLTARVAILYGGLAHIFNIRRVSVFEGTHVVDVWSGGDNFSRKGGERVAAGCWH